MRTTSRKNIARSLALLLGIASIPAVHAQYYGGLSLKRIQSSVFDGEVTPVPGLYALTSNPLESRYGFRLKYRMTPNVAVEGGYAETGRTSFLGESVFSSTRPRATGLDVGVTGSLPVFDKFSLLGRAGLSRTNGATALPLNLYPLNPNSLRTGSAGSVGVGMQYDVSRSLGLRFEVVRHHAFGTTAPGETDSDGFSFGVSFKF